MLAGDTLFRIMYFGAMIAVVVALHWILFGLTLWIGRRWAFAAKASRTIGIALSVLCGIMVLYSMTSIEPIARALTWVALWAGFVWPLVRAGRRLRPPAPEVAE